MVPLNVAETILVDVFRKTPDELGKLFRDIHKLGKVAVGTFTYDIAETKALWSKHKAKMVGHDLEFSMKIVPLAESDDKSLDNQPEPA